MSDEAQIMQILHAQPDEGYYRRRGSWGSNGSEAKPVMQQVEIYLRGDEIIEEDGTYIKIETAVATVYIARDMIERLAKDVLQGESVAIY